MLYALAGDGASDLFADRHARHSRPLTSFDRRTSAASAARAALSASIERPLRWRAVLEVTNIKKRFGGITAVDGVQLRGAGGRNSRHDRPERLRQVDPVQLHPRPTHAERAAKSRSTVASRRACAPATSTGSASAAPSSCCRCFRRLSVRENLILAGQEHQGTMLSRLVRPSRRGPDRRPPTR